MKSAGDFAAILRAWRRRRGWSQLELAGRADISQRHPSFLEIGRASPSREMVEANRGAARLVEFLVGPLAPDARVNLADALLGPDVLRPSLVNWAEVARYFIRSIKADAAADGTAATAALLQRLLSYEGVRPLLKASAGPAADPVLPMVFRKGEVLLELFTTIATLGTPQDVTLQELRIESFFPMRDGTAEIFRDWAAAAAF